MVVAVEPGVNRIRFAGSVALEHSRLALDDRRVHRFTNKFGRDEYFNPNAPFVQLAGRLHSSAASKVSVVLQTHFADQHAVVLDHVLVVCIWSETRERKKKKNMNKNKQTKGNQ